MSQVILDGQPVTLDGVPVFLDGAADVTAPTVLSATISSSGLNITIAFSEPVTGTAGFTLAMSGGAVTLTHASSAFSEATYSLSRTVYQGETGTLSYAPGNVQDLAGNPMLAFTTAVSNWSTAQVPIDPPQFVGFQTIKVAPGGAVGFNLADYFINHGQQSLSFTEVQGSFISVNLSRQGGAVFGFATSTLGLYEILVRATDQAGQSVTGLFSIQVKVAPVVTAASVSVAGTQLTVSFDRVVTGSNGFTVQLTNGPATLSLASGAGTATRVYAFSRQVAFDEVVTLSYSGTAVKDSDNFELAAFSGMPVVNNSTYVPPPILVANIPNLRSTIDRNANRNFAPYFKYATTIEMIAGTLPTGLSFSAGSVTGVPTTLQVQEGLRLRAVNAQGNVQTNLFSWTIREPVPGKQTSLIVGSSL
jgi:hypothetical protein